MPARKRHATLRKDGRWQCKACGKTFIDRDIEKAREKADIYEAQVKLNQAEALKPKTVRTYAAEWLPIHKNSVSNRHYDACANHIDRLTKVCGDLLLSEVKPDDAARVWVEYAGMSASTVRKAAQIFRAIFDSAIENDFCTKNPFRAKTAAPPKAESGSHRALEQGEISLILSTPHRLQAAVMVMLYAGLRRGEVIALTSADIDLDQGVIRVDKAVRYDSNAAILDTPKTSAGVRTVPIPDALRPILKDIKGYVAPSASGGMMTEQAWQRAWDM
jgi:integrase